MPKESPNTNLTVILNKLNTDNALHARHQSPVELVRYRCGYLSETDT